VAGWLPTAGGPPSRTIAAPSCTPAVGIAAVLVNVLIDKSPLALDVCDDPGTLQDCARIGGNKLLLDVARRLSAPNAIGGPTSAVQSGDSGAAKLHVQWNWANV